MWERLPHFSTKNKTVEIILARDFSQTNWRIFTKNQNIINVASFHERLHIRFLLVE